MFLVQVEQNTETEQLKRAFCQTLVAAAQRLPQSPIREEIVEFLLIVPHVAEVATTYLAWVVDEDLFYPFISLGRFYEGQGSYREAEVWLTSCLEATQKRLGNEHHQVATSLNNLALLYRTQGRYEEAESRCCQSLKILEHLFGENHKDIHLRSATLHVHVRHSAALFVDGHAKMDTSCAHQCHPS